MARKVGFGERRSVLGRKPAPERTAGRGSPPSRSGDGMGRAAIFLGFALLYGVPLLFAVIGAYPLFGALSFPERAHEAQAEITGRSSVQRPGEPERVTSLTVNYETRIGAKLTTDLATDQNREIGESLVIFYDPDSPRYVRLTREVSFAEAMARVGDRIYFSYFALGFMALVTVMAIAAFTRRGRAG